MIRPNRVLKTVLTLAVGLGTLAVAPAAAQAAPVTAPAGVVAPAMLPPDGGTTTAELRTAITTQAAALVGKYPYTWGGGHGTKPGATKGTCGAGYQGPKPCIDDHVKGFDCSGYVRYVLFRAGMGDMSLTANGFMHSSKLHSITKSQLKPGDLIFFGSSKSTANHVAIYAGNGMMYEAAGHSLDIVKSKITRRSDVIAYKTLF